MSIQYTPELEQYLRSNKIPVTGVLARDLIVGGVDRDNKKLFDIAIILGIALLVLILYINDYRQQQNSKFGLPGGNNNCFLNSVMQQLRYTPHIEKLLEKNSKLENKQSNILYDFLKRMKTGNVKKEELKKFRESLEWKDDKDGNYKGQQDAFTLLQFIIDRNETDEKIKKQFKIGVPIIILGGDSKSEYHYNISYFTTNGNNINDIKYDKNKLTDLSTPFFETKGFSKNDFKIVDEPVVFPETMIISKGDNKHMLDISDIIKLTLVNEENEYKLSGVIVRIGASYESGHYYSYIRDPKTGSWTWFNDDKVKTGLSYNEIDRDIAGKGYVFFYNKIEKPIQKSGGYELSFYFCIIIFIIIIIIIILLIFSQKIHRSELRIFH